MIDKRKLWNNENNKKKSQAWENGRYFGASLTHPPFNNNYYERCSIHHVTSIIKSTHMRELNP